MSYVYVKANQVTPHSSVINVEYAPSAGKQESVISNIYMGAPKRTISCICHARRKLSVFVDKTIWVEFFGIFALMRHRQRVEYGFISFKVTHVYISVTID
jgi:hypothetical protein